jgi:serine/threonine protein phosphatase 1
VSKRDARGRRINISTAELFAARVCADVVFSREMRRRIFCTSGLVSDTYFPARQGSLVLFRRERPQAPRVATAPANDNTVPFNLLRRRAPRAPIGQRVYAIGDIHGRADLLDDLLTQIDADLRTCALADRPALVFLGDYIDRGTQSRQVIDRLLALSRARYDCHFLRGNHEVALLNFLERPASGQTWLNYGGAETLYAYGVKAPVSGASERDFRNAASALRMALPQSHLEFLQGLQLYARLGDYLFVHAGLRPGKPLARQNETDLLEIRDPFLKSKARWPFTIVHGHSPVTEAARGHGRIALDTGAYATGKLSAVRLEGESVAFLST